MPWEHPPTAHQEATEALHAIADALRRQPFKPALRSGHLQTAVGSQVGGGPQLAAAESEVRLEDGAVVKTLALRPDRDRRLLLVHGMGGDLTSPYMRSMARLAVEAGLGVTLVEHYNAALEDSPRVFHAASGDVLRAVVEAERERGASHLVLAGVSLGANVVLNAVADYGGEPPREIRGAVVLSPLVDLVATWPVLERMSNRAYVVHFLKALKGRLRREAKALTGHLDLDAALASRSVRAFDTEVVVPLSGFRDIWDYYDRGSAGPRLSAAAAPIVYLHAADDPIIPFSPLFSGSLRSPNHLAVVPRHGGHGGFIDRSGKRWGDQALVNAAQTMLEV